MPTHSVPRSNYGASSQYGGGAGSGWIGTGRGLGRRRRAQSCQHYEGAVNGAALELLWLADLTMVITLVVATLPGARGP